MNRPATLAAALPALLLVTLPLAARADAITAWNAKTSELIAESRLGTPPAIRASAIVQSAALLAVQNAAASAPRGSAAPAATLDAAVAAAHRGTLQKLLPTQQAAIEAAYQAALAPIADGPARLAGVAHGERAAAELLAQRGDDGAGVAETYRPLTSAGQYVPTAPAAVPQWVQRKPWLMTTPSQFRPGPPPPLASPAWARDYDEVKSLGGRASTRRSAEQTDIARFWDYSLPAIYYGTVHSLAAQAPRDLLAQARLFAAVAQAMDDALIGVMDAKYAHHFWRPVTAIRNGDIDGNDATLRDASWSPLIDTPMHPEYPSAHSTLAVSMAVVLDAERAGAALPVLSTSSPTAKGAVRRWTRLDEFTREVADARVHAGIHFRSATDAGDALGKRVGELAVARLLRPAAP